MLNGIVFPSSSTVTLEIINAFNNHKDISSIVGVNSHANYEFKKLSRPVRFRKAESNVVCSRLN